MRASTVNAPPPVITDRPAAEPLTQFRPVTPDEVPSVLKNAPAKRCLLDPVLTWFVKKLSTVFAPVIANIVQPTHYFSGPKECHYTSAVKEKVTLRQ